MQLLYNLRHKYHFNILSVFPYSFMYFGDLYCCIWRANLDGSNPIKIINNLIDIRDISVDAINSTLYWNVGGHIYKSNLSGGDRERVLLNLSDTTSLSANNGTLYLSKRRTDQNGSLFTYSYGLLSTVIEGSSLDPGDISTFLPKSFLMSSKFMYMYLCLLLSSDTVCGW